MIDYSAGFEKAQHLLVLADDGRDRSDVDVALAKPLVYLEARSLEPFFVRLYYFFLFQRHLSSPSLCSELQGVVRGALLHCARELRSAYGT